MVKIDKNRCVGCGICVNICPKVGRIWKSILKNG